MCVRRNCCTVGKRRKPEDRRWLRNIDAGAGVFNAFCPREFAVPAACAAEGTWEPRIRFKIASKWIRSMLRQADQSNDNQRDHLMAAREIGSAKIDEAAEALRKGIQQEREDHAERLRRSTPQGSAAG
jgi:hypothetical protein